MVKRTGSFDALNGSRESLKCSTLLASVDGILWRIDIAGRGETATSIGPGAANVQSPARYADSAHRSSTQQACGGPEG
jgi:hypothetical protein